jgi:NADPH:quinone reductase
VSGAPGRAAVISRPGGTEVLRVEARPVPGPGPHDVLVRVHASAMNRADVLQRMGRYPPPSGAPADVPGLELAGRVHAVGDRVTRWRAGDRVFGLVPGGAHADYALAHADTLVAIPDMLDWTSAGAVPEAFITAFDALQQATMKGGDVVLVHAAASGVGIAAVQLVRAFGGTALGTARSADKLGRLRPLGLAHGYDASGGVAALPQWVRGASAGRGADVALDLVGGDYFPATLHALAPQGRIVVIGLLAGADATIPLGLVLRNRLTIRGTALRSRGVEERVHDTRVFADRVLPLLRDGIVRPVVDAVFPLNEIAAAHERMESNATFGKIVLRMTDEA